MYRVSSISSTTRRITAIGQGALGIEIRRDDARTREAVSFLDDRETSLAVRAERGFLKRLEGGCQVPIGAHAREAGERLQLRAVVIAPDGGTVIARQAEGLVAELVDRVDALHLAVGDADAVVEQSRIEVADLKVRGLVDRRAELG